MHGTKYEMLSIIRSLAELHCVEQRIKCPLGYPWDYLHQEIINLVFLLVSALGSSNPYMVVYMRQLGLTPSESAIIVSFKCFAAAVFQPVFGFVADKFQKHKLIMILLLIISSILLGCLLFVPPTTPDMNRTGADEVHFFCGINNSYMVICDEQNTNRDKIKQNTNNTSNLNHFTCTVTEMASNICIYGTRPAGVRQCLGVDMNTSSFDISMELDSLPLQHMEIKRDKCQYRAVISVNDNANNTLFDMHCGDNTTFLCNIHHPPINEHISGLAPDESRKFSITFWLFGFIFITSNIANIPYTI